MTKKGKIVLTLGIMGVLIAAIIIGFIVLNNNKTPKPAEHTHSYIETITKTPTCAEKGEKTYTCDCGNSYTEDIAALGHDYQTEITAPTCTEQGFTTYTCSRCGDSYVGDYVAKTDHDYEWTTTKEPTETEDGIKTGVCKLCGDTITKIIPSLNHEHNYVETVVAPTCTTDGYTLHQCYCEDYYITDETPALGHDFGEWVETTTPTCTTHGEETRYCSRDNTHTDTRLIPALGHDYVLTENVPATCTENGRITYTCTVCGHVKQQTVIATGHYFGDDNVCDVCGYELSIIHAHEYSPAVVAPTCTTMGYTDYVCSCGASYRADYIEPLGHKYNDGVIIQDKTCTENGIIEYTCIRCGATYTDTIPAGHTWSETITEPATCTTDGRAYRVCTVCGEEETVIIPAGHTWDEGVIITPATCTEIGSKLFTCLVCGAEEERAYGPLGHRYVNGVCTRCGAKFIDNVSEYPDHPVYGFYFLLDEIRSDYGPRLINEYGALLYVNEGAQLDKVAVYITQDDILWRRCIACTGTNIEFAIFVPYLSYGNEIIYTGLNSSAINTFALSKGTDGIWRYSEYATIGANLADYQGNLLLDLYDIGQAGAKTRVFDDLSKMKAWLKGENPDTVHTHTVVIDEGIAATCTQNGLTAGSHCSVCGVVIVARELIPAGHTPDSAVQENYVAPTCANSGSYDSVVYCAVCMEELSREQVVVPATGVHNYVNGVCTVCGAEEPVITPPQSDVYTIDGDYIYFGTYPQSDVTATKGSELSSYVQTKPSNGNNNGWISYNYYINSSNTTDFMWYKDVDIDNNGTKDYRAVYFTSYRPYLTDYSSSTGNTYQGDNGYYISNVYWFKYEPIKWRILSQANGKATILAELILDSQDYNYTSNSRTINNKTVYANNYAYSRIRAWLNDNFYNTAFNDYEKAIINTIEVDNSARSTNPDNNATYCNSGTNNYACENTYDKVWLLSAQEVTTAAYGFDESPTAYDTLRQKKTSAYAQCQGAYTYNYGGDYDGNGYWWLRSSDYYYDDGAWFVGHVGYASRSISSVYYTGYGVVPALQITLVPITPPTDDSYFTFTLLSDDTYEIAAKNKNNMPAEVILPSTHDNKPVTCIGECAFYNCSSLTSITIPYSVTSIGNYAFNGCSSLTSITIPDSVTSIGNYAFNGCSSLTSITIPDSVTSIGDDAFSGCSSLTSITIPDSVTSIGYSAFSRCSSLTSINVDKNNEYYKSIDGNLYSKDGTTLIQYAIGKTATEFTIPDNVTSIEYGAFYYCSSLTSINIPNGVTSIGDSVFYNCSSLTSITIPDSITSIGYGTFANCSSLTSIIIPDSVTSIGNYAFHNCSSLMSITIPSGVKSIGYGAFKGCSSLTSIYYGGTAGSWDNIVIELYNTDLTNATRCYYSENYPEIFAEYTYWHYIDDLLIIWGVTDDSYFNFTLLPDNTYEVKAKDINNMPAEVVLSPIYDNKPVTRITGFAFIYCSGLTSIIIPSSVTSIRDFAFSGCSSLTSITVDENNEYYKSIGGNLYSKDGTTLIQYAIGKTATEFTISDSVTSIGREAFYKCISLMGITIPDSVTSIGMSAFYVCSSLTSITIPDSVTSIGDWAFELCSSLTSIMFNGTIEQWDAISKGVGWNDNVPATVVHCTDGDVAI